MLLLIPTHLLYNGSNPWNRVIWPELDKPITLREIELAIFKGKLVSPAIKYAHDYDHPEFDRDFHVGKIAWFVVHGYKHPIIVDALEDNFYNIGDGNHRFFSTIIKRDPWTPCWVTGPFERIEKMFLNKGAKSLTLLM